MQEFPPEPMEQPAVPVEQRFLGQILPDMEVADGNGEPIGTVAHIYRHDLNRISMAGSSRELPEEVIEVKTGLLGLGKHFFVPMSAVQDITFGCLFLSRRRDELEGFGWDKRPSYLEELLH